MFVQLNSSIKNNRHSVLSVLICLLIITILFFSGCAVASPERDQDTETADTEKADASSAVLEGEAGAENIEEFNTDESESLQPDPEASWQEQRCRKSQQSYPRDGKSYSERRMGRKVVPQGL